MEVDLKVGEEEVPDDEANLGWELEEAGGVRHRSIEDVRMGSVLIWWDKMQWLVVDLVLDPRRGMNLYELNSLSTSDLCT